MNRHQIEHIINGHYSSLRKQFRKAKKHFDDEAIHQFRVEYKKLRAFLRLISWRKEGKETAKITGRLKRCYAVAGSIRDLQLQQHRLHENKISGDQHAYIHKLQKHINTLKPSFRKLLSKKAINKSKKKTKAIIPEVLGAKDFKKYFGKIGQSISVILNQENITDKDIHKVRKLLKDLSYNHKEIEKLNNNGFAFNEYGFSNEEFDQLLEEIGNFVDKCKAIDLLNAEWTRKMNKENQSSLLRTKTMFLQDKSKLKHALEERMMNELPHTVA